MSNLALQAQADTAYLLPLWESVQRLIMLWAYQYIKTKETRLFDADDLMQSGYLAMADALRTFDPDKGAFSTHLRYYVRLHFNELAGIRTSKRDAVNYATSLDIYRQGQTKPVMVYHLVTDGTIDEDVMTALEGKATGQAALLRAVKARVIGARTA